MKQAELVFIPATAFSHIVASVETAKLLLERAERRLSITVLILNPIKDTTVETYTQKTASSNPRLRLMNLTAPTAPPTPSLAFIHDYIKSRVAPVLAIVSHLVEQNPNSRLAGLVLDVFTTNFVAVADELGLPWYIFSPFGASYVGMSRHLTHLISMGSGHDRRRHADVKLSSPYSSVPIPTKVLPGWELDEDDPTAEVILKLLKRLPEAKGIVVNTFYELEPYAIDALVMDQPDCGIYPVGPILNSNSINGEDHDHDEVKEWLDDQHKNSVVFLCFGSLWSLDEAQVREMALALEKSGCKFLWALRNLEEVVLPEGFLERTKGVGKLIKWAAQVAVLAHAAVGLFVSHCGWNSTLESVWNGVPIAAFPMFAEQHLNAFQMAAEVGVAEAITLDYRADFMGEKPPWVVVGWEEIAAVLRRLMAAEGGRGVREKAEEMQKKARAALVEGGSSHVALGGFIEDVMRNIA